MNSTATFAVVGYQNAGKTTLVEHLVRVAANAGLRVAHLKHDGHADTTEVPDWEKPTSDTVRTAAAGARWTMVASRRGWLVHDWQDGGADLANWLHVLNQAMSARGERADVIVIEGGKHSDLPKVAVITTSTDARALSTAGVSGIVAYVAGVNASYETLLNVQLDAPLFAFEDNENLLSYILDSLSKSTL